MTDEEGLSVRETAEWCGSGKVREITRLRRLTSFSLSTSKIGSLLS
jgi:hypothetical protein